MTTQAPSSFGVDIWIDPATGDADSMWSTVTGVALADWGFNLARLAGATAGTAASYQGRLKRVVLKDQRIDSADVVITETQANGLVTLTITIAAQTALGPFRLVFLLDPSSAPGSQLSLIENQ